jgi:hypothetical protein
VLSALFGVWRPRPCVSTSPHGSLLFVVELKVPVSKSQGTKNLSWIGSIDESTGLPQGLFQYIAQLVRELDGVGGPDVRFGMLCNFATTVFAKMVKTEDDMYSLELWRLDVVPQRRRSADLTKSRGFTAGSLAQLALAIRRFVLWGKSVSSAAWCHLLLVFQLG